MKNKKYDKYILKDFVLTEKHIYARNKLTQIYNNILKKIKKNQFGGMEMEEPDYNYNNNVNGNVAESDDKIDDALADLKDMTQTITNFNNNDIDTFLGSFKTKIYEYFNKVFNYDNTWFNLQLSNNIDELLDADEKLTNEFKEFFKEINNNNAYKKNENLKSYLISIYQGLFNLQTKIIFNKLKILKKDIDITPLFKVLNEKIQYMNNYMDDLNTVYEENTTNKHITEDEYASQSKEYTTPRKSSISSESKNGISSDFKSDTSESKNNTPSDSKNYKEQKDSAEIEMDGYTYYDDWKDNKLSLDKIKNLYSFNFKFTDNILNIYYDHSKAMNNNNLMDNYFITLSTEHNCSQFKFLLNNILNLIMFYKNKLNIDENLTKLLKQESAETSLISESYKLLKLNNKAGWDSLINIIKFYNTNAEFAANNNNYDANIFFEIEFIVHLTNQSLNRRIDLLDVDNISDDKLNEMIKRLKK